MSRYEIPYTARSGARGTLRVWADTPTEALVAARAIHARRLVATTPAFTVCGPGRVGSGPDCSVKALPKKERDAMVYGEPVVVTDDPALARQQAADRARVERSKRDAATWVTGLVVP